MHYEMPGKVLLVGISGTTNSGKSTLASKLVKELSNSIWICQDSYFLPPGHPKLAPLYIPELDHHNWEDYRSLNMDRMVEDVKRVVAAAQSKGDNTTILFIEGFSIFGFRPLEVLLDKKYCITVDRDVCWARRQKRNYIPPDKPGYFDQVVWPCYQAHMKQIQDQTDIEYFNGNDGVADLFKKICEDIESVTSKKDKGS